LDRTVMIVAAMAPAILGGIAFTRIVNTLATLADALALAKRPVPKFLIAFFFMWGVEALLIRSVSILAAGLHTFAGNESSAYVTAAHVGFGLTAWIMGMITCGLATLLLPRFDDDARCCAGRHIRAESSGRRLQGRRGTAASDRCIERSKGAQP